MSLSKTMFHGCVMLILACLLLGCEQQPQTKPAVKTATWTAGGIKVVITQVVRDGDTALPASVSPGKEAEVDVQILDSNDQSKDMTGTDHHVEFVIVNETNNADGGTAEMVEGSNTLVKSGKIKIRGGNQNKPENWGKLKIAAKIDGQGNAVVLSPEFGVCAHPDEVKITFQTVLENIPNALDGGASQVWGAYYPTSATSDAAQPAQNDLAETEITEILAKEDASGYLDNVTLTPATFGPTTQMVGDQHVIGIPWPDPNFPSPAVSMIDAVTGGGGAGSVEIHQYFRFSCKRCGIPANAGASPVVRKSGFKVLETLEQDNAGKWFIRVKKEEFSNHGAAAGVSTDQGQKSAEIKN